MLTARSWPVSLVMKTASVILILAIGLLVQACTAFVYSERDVSEIGVGSGREQVEDALGEPVETITSGPNEIVTYAYTSGFDESKCPYLDPFAAITLGILSLPPGVCTNNIALAYVYGSEDTVIYVQRFRTVTEVEEEVQRVADAKALAESGDADGQYQYGLYLRGKTLVTVHLSQNASRRLSWKWLCHAANQGHAGAQSDLGHGYKNGSELLAMDLVQAFLWYKLADDGQSPWRGARVQKVREQMTITQITEAERLVAEWTPNPAECETIGAQAEN